LVDRGIRVRRELKRLKAELDDIEATLKAVGLSREHECLVDADREGRRWMASGSEVVVPVIFTADKIMGSFAINSAKHQQIKLHAGDAFPEFWKPIHTYENRFDDGKKFRKRADEVLGPKAPSYVTACLARDKAGLPKSDVRVEWDRAEETTDH
jgi:hypothetical protein